MLPQMHCHPCAAHLPECRSRIHILRTAVSIDIGIVMAHGSPAAIHSLRHIPSSFLYRMNQVKKRFMECGQITDFRRPVIHLQIDIRRIFALPTGTKLMIPNTLQVHGRRALSSGRYHHISSILEIHSCFLVLRKRKRTSFHIRGEIRNMVSPDISIPLCTRCRKRRLHIADKIFFPVIRRSHQINYDLARFMGNQLRITVLNSSIRHHSQAAGKSCTIFIPLHHQGMAIFGIDSLTSGHRPYTGADEFSRSPVIRQPLIRKRDTIEQHIQPDCFLPIAL